MLNKIKGIIARLTIKDETDYCMYCILDTLNKNLRGLSYTTMRDTIGLYFTEKTFKTAWFTLKDRKYIIPINHTDRYIIGVKILEYPYEYLL